MVTLAPLFKTSIYAGFFMPETTASWLKPLLHKKAPIQIEALMQSKINAID